jgi:hypothetical protein
LGSILVPGPVLAGGQFSILVLRLVPVMVPEFLLLKIYNQWSRYLLTGPRNGIGLKPELDNTGKHTYSLVSLRK